MATILHINISRGGIPKRPIHDAQVTAGGIIGDGWAHPKIHGGPRQALLLITAEGIEELAAQSFPVSAGALGENLTTVGLDRRHVRFGQRYRIGEQVVIEITKLRTPCSTLNTFGRGIQTAMFDVATKAGDTASPRWGLSGFYASVVQSGPIHTGDRIALIPSQGLPVAYD